MEDYGLQYKNIRTIITVLKRISNLRSFLENEKDVALMNEEVITQLTMEEQLFLTLANDPVSRAGLLERLETLGLLSAFLEAENGTTE